MAEFKGTKTEWKLQKGSNNKFSKIIVGENKAINFNYKTEDFETEIYDALLISKAPEMLEMLIICKDAMYELLDHQDGWEEDLENLEQLIKEATEL